MPSEVETWRARWTELPMGQVFSEGPYSTEILVAPAGPGWWKWTVSQHTATAFAQCSSGMARTRFTALAAAEDACRRVAFETRWAIGR